MPAPQPPSNNQHSSAEAPELLQGAGTKPPLPLSQHNPSTSENSSCYRTELAQTTTEKKPKNPHNLSGQPEFILSGLSMQVMNRLDLVGFYELSKTTEQGTAQL